MDQISEEQSKLLSSKEWLVKVDTQRSTPYLFKFHSSKIDLSCFVMVTDTKSVWTEVLTSSQIARRWRACNKADSFVAFSVEEEEAEEEWRLSIIDNLSKVHTPGGMNNASFEIINSRSSDFAFEIEYEGFKWTWEACFIGYKNSAEIISKHLLLPLISLTHTVLSVGKPAGEMAESELEKAIDGVGRAARRSFDTHVKNAISKPRMNTSIRRMTALFSLADPLPPISFMNEEVKLQIASPPRPRVQVRVPGPTKARAVSPGPMEQSNLAKTPPKQPSPSFSFVPRELSANPPRQNSADNSATESDDNEPDAKVAPVAAASLVVIPDSPAERSGSSHTSPPSISKTIYSDSDSSLPRPAMKKKKEASSSEDSEEERRKRVARLKSGTAGSRGGVRQPLKRGGKRF